MLMLERSDFGASSLLDPIKLGASIGRDNKESKEVPKIDPRVSDEQTPIKRKRRRPQKEAKKVTRSSTEMTPRPAPVKQTSILECQESLEEEDSMTPLEPSPRKVRRVVSKYIADFQSIIEMDFNPDMVQWMIGREKSYQPLPYLTLQAHVDSNMRSILFDWMMEVSQEFTLGRETMHLAVNYVDRFLCRVNANIILETTAPSEEIGPIAPITRSNLQLLGVACLFIASKLEEIYPPNAGEFSVTTDGGFTAAQIDAMERRVLKVLNWNLHAQTPFSWIKLYLKICCKALHETIHDETDFDKKTKTPDEEIPKTQAEQLSLFENLLSVTNLLRMMELIDTATLCSSFVRFYPSAIAAAALYVVVPQARCLIKRATGYPPDALKPCVALLNSFITLPFQGLKLPTKPYFDSKSISEEPYTRQAHHPKALELVQELLTRGFSIEEEPSISDVSTELSTDSENLSSPLKSTSSSSGASPVSMSSSSPMKTTPVRNRKRGSGHEKHNGTYCHQDDLGSFPEKLIS